MESHREETKNKREIAKEKKAKRECGKEDNMRRERNREGESFLMLMFSLIVCWLQQRAG